MASKTKGRPVGVRLTKRQADHTRAGIQVSHIIDRMNKCLKGDIKLSNEQIRCGIALLDKALPSLQATELTNITENSLEALSDNDLQAVISAAEDNVTPIKAGTKGK